jgi:hypothetical protein
MRYIRYALLASVLGLVLGCAPSRPLLTDQMVIDVSILKDQIRQSRLTFPEATKGDSLYTIAEQLRADHKERLAYHYFDYAMILYRLALVKKQLVETSEKTKELESTLNATTTKMQAYEQQINDLKASQKK